MLKANLSVVTALESSTITKPKITGRFLFCVMHSFCLRVSYSLQHISPSYNIELRLLVNCYVLAICEAFERRYSKLVVVDSNEEVQGRVQESD